MASRADLLDAVNAARLHGCPLPARVPLQIDSQLANAAARLADGQSLHDALAAAGYLPARSSAVHLSGAVGDTDVARTLAAGYCSTLAAANLTQMGALRRGRDVWMVLAAPVILPATDAAAAVSRQILRMLNAARASGYRCGTKLFASAQPLTLDPSLTAAALAHSQEMARYAEFEHRGHDGTTPAMRVARAGLVAYSVIGENIAAGAMSPAEVAQGWLASPPHCENIMDPRFSQTGIAFSVNRSSAELVYWTQDFAAPGRRRGGAASSP